jgi:tetratricopeptide (TPR) repeat protein
MNNAKNLLTRLAVGLLILGTTSFMQGASPEAAAHANKGKDLVAAGKLDEAIVEYNKAIEISPKDEVLYRNRGVIFRTANKLPEALADFTKAIELAPKSELGYIERGQLQMMQNQYDAALADYNKAIEVNPNNVIGYDRRGFAYYKMGKHDEAIQDYTTSIEKKADNPTTYSRRADAYVAKNQFDKALPDLEMALKLKPGDFDTETLTQRGVVKFYLPGAGVLFIDVGRAVIPPDEGLVSETGLHQFDQYFGGDTSVLERVCEALGSPGTPPLS